MSVAARWTCWRWYQETEPTEMRYHYHFTYSQVNSWLNELVWHHRMWIVSRFTVKMFTTIRHSKFLCCQRIGSCYLIFDKSVFEEFQWTLDEWRLIFENVNENDLIYWHFMILIILFWSSADAVVHLPLNFVRWHHNCTRRNWTDNSFRRTNCVFFYVYKMSHIVSHSLRSNNIIFHYIA